MDASGTTCEDERMSSNWTQDPASLLRVGEGFRLGDVDPESTPGYDGDKKAGQKDLAAAAPDLDDLQERLFAAHHDQETGPAVLLVLQAMDTAGKGGIVRHVVAPSTRRASNSPHSRSPPRRSSPTTSSGASARTCRARA